MAFASDTIDLHILSHNIIDQKTARTKPQKDTLQSKADLFSTFEKDLWPHIANNFEQQLCINIDLSAALTPHAHFIPPH